MVPQSSPVQPWQDGGGGPGHNEPTFSTRATPRTSQERRGSSPVGAVLGQQRDRGSSVQWAVSPPLPSGQSFDGGHPGQAVPQSGAWPANQAGQAMPQSGALPPGHQYGPNFDQLQGYPVIASGAAGFESGRGPPNGQQIPAAWPGGPMVIPSTPHCGHVFCPIANLPSAMFPNPMSYAGHQMPPTFMQQSQNDPSGFNPATNAHPCGCGAEGSQEWCTECGAVYCSLCRRSHGRPRTGERRCIVNEGQSNQDRRLVASKIMTRKRPWRSFGYGQNGSLELDDEAASSLLRDDDCPLCRGNRVTSNGQPCVHGMCGTCLLEKEAQRVMEEATNALLCPMCLNYATVSPGSQEYQAIHDTILHSAMCNCRAAEAELALCFRCQQPICKQCGLFTRTDGLPRGQQGAPGSTEHNEHTEERPGLDADGINQQGGPLRPQRQQTAGLPAEGSATDNNMICHMCQNPADEDLFAMSLSAQRGQPYSAYKVIDGGLKGDTEAVMLRDICALCSHVVVATDWRNQCVKAWGRPRDGCPAMASRVQLESPPHGIAEVDDCTVVVSMPDERRIVFLHVRSSGKLDRRYTVTTVRKCYGMAGLSGGRVAATCPWDKVVDILGRHGELLETVLTCKVSDSDTYWPEYICTLPTNELILSDLGHQQISSVAPDGRLRWVSERGRLKEPQGIAVDTVGQFFVADGASGSVWRMTAGGLDLQKLLWSVHGLKKPRSLAWKDGFLYVADASFIKVFAPMEATPC